ncbi:MAG: glycerol-3-phosphate 1-O-acyltransferase PlsY [Lachnospiraceae bacterium]|nr:glycerol-3-phosphate 1-O-acyltransferase PlsY [Lachnospiraceae bacterium]
MERIACLAIGYVLGLFQTAYFYGRLHGIDIRQHGSGNAGTTNALRVLGRKAGLVVFLGDVFKCAAAVGISVLLFGKSQPDMVYLLKLYAAAGAILGHNFPFYLKFRGGKGIAATAGLILSFHPAFLLVGFVVFLGTFLITHYVSLGSLLVYAALFIQMIVSGQMGLFGGADISVLIEMYVLTGLLTVMAYYRHRENIIRLLKGEERKTYLSKAKKV